MNLLAKGLGALVVALAFAPPVGEAAGQEASPPGASLSVYLLTVEQGDAVWERFSHNAILIRDRDTGWEEAYNWGIFDFDQVDFVPRLIRGTMLYRMAPFPVPWFLEQTRRENRRMWAQELALTPQQRWDLLTFVQWNAQPENMYYRYDYYQDNCSTRVRDALDRVLGGRIRELAQAETTTHTYRWHTRRLLQDTPWAYLGIQTVLGPSADRPLTAWEETFLPRRLMEVVRQVDVPDGRDGTRPLVVEERLLVDSSRPPVPTAPPFAFPWFLLVGALWGGGIVLLSGSGEPPGPMRRLGLFLLAGGWAFGATLAGSLLLGAWFFTDHVFWYRNQNLFQANPLFLLVAIAYVVFLFRGTLPGWSRKVVAWLGVVAGAGFLISVLPGVGQANGEFLALSVPLNGGLVLGVFRSLQESRPGGRRLSFSSGERVSDGEER